MDVKRHSPGGKRAVEDNAPRDEDLSLAREVAARLRARFGSRIRHIILFGSRARGTAKPYSDFDMMLVLPKRDRGTIDEIYEVTYDFELEHEIDLSLKIYSQDAFRRGREMRTPFVRSVLETGIELLPMKNGTL